MKLDPRKTALVLIDLQNGVVSRPSLAPYSAAEVMQKSAQLAQVFRSAGATIVYVRVDINDFLQLPADSPGRDPNAPPLPASASELAPESGVQSGDLIITKRHWGAFNTTDLEEQLRSRGIDTVVLGGIATHIGVESTAREGAGRGFAFVVVEDITTSMDEASHRFSFENIFPRLARVRTTEQVIEAIN